MKKAIKDVTVLAKTTGTVTTVGVILCVWLIPIGAHADLTDQPVPWDTLVAESTVVPKTANGVPLRDYQTSSDPSSGGTGVGGDTIDIGSEWNGIDDPTAPHELCNPELSALTPNGRCGTGNSAYWGYWHGDDPDPAVWQDDVIFLRMRLVASPKAGGNALDFEVNHWNFLIDVDHDGYKDYWLDVDGGFNQGSASNRIDHIQLLYEPTSVPEIDCGGGSPSQLVNDPDDARVAEFVACAGETTDPSHPCALSHTRVLPADDGSQFFLEVQLPITALKDLNCDQCPGTGGVSCVAGEQLVYPIPGGAPDVAYLFSTGNSGVNPLQKDYIADCVLTGNPPDGPCSFPDATPVSLASVFSSKNGAAVAVDWTTATQTATVGFNVYAVDDRSWRRLNEELIPAGAANTIEPQHFSFEGLGDAEFVGIEDVDAFGGTRRHGPYRVGSTHGRQPDGPATDWAGIRSEFEAFNADRTKSNPAARQDGKSPRVDFIVNRDGVHRVSHQELVEAGFDFSSVPAAHLALVGPDGPVPILVSGGAIFGPGSTIEFVGRALASLYTQDNRLSLMVNKELARRIKTDSRPPRSGDVALWYMAAERVERHREYTFSTPVEDPWYDTSMVTYTSPKEWSFELRADSLAAVAPAELFVRLWGGTDWPASPDHHAVIKVNGALVGERIFDGLAEEELKIVIPNGVLQTGANTLTIELPGDTGVAWDVIQLDSYELRYPRHFTADGPAYGFRAAGEVIRVEDFPDNRFVIYTFEPTPTRITGAVIERSGSGYSVRFGGTSKPTDHLITTEEAVLAPMLQQPVQGTPPISHRNDLLIIAHPQFIEGLAPLVAARRAEGLLVEVADLDLVYGAYSDGIIDPHAISSYVADGHSIMGTRFVLLVGGDTFDYHDHLGLGSISFIPSIYAATDQYITHAPVDPLYGDVDGDGVPEVAVGRFPVRSLDELNRLVTKTLAFGHRHAKDGSAVIAADVYDSAQDLLFTGFAERLAGDLPSSWTISKAYVDSVGFDEARATLLEGINLGATLTSYFGHSGPTMWSFDGLLHVDDVTALTNHGRPTVVLQWGCWNTYFVEPRYDSIGMALLLHGDQGASAVIGSTTLSWVPSSYAFSELFGPLIAQSGMRIGDAMVEAKRQLAAKKLDVDDVILGWTLLGDPTLVLEPGSSFEDRR